MRRGFVPSVFQTTSEVRSSGFPRPVRSLTAICRPSGDTAGKTARETEVVFRVPARQRSAGPAGRRNGLDRSPLIHDLAAIARPRRVADVAARGGFARAEDQRRARSRLGQVTDAFRIEELRRQLQPRTRRVLGARAGRDIDRHDPRLDRRLSAEPACPEGVGDGELVKDHACAVGRPLRRSRELALACRQFAEIPAVDAHHVDACRLHLFPVAARSHQRRAAIGRKRDPAPIRRPARSIVAAWRVGQVSRPAGLQVEKIDVGRSRLSRRHERQ